LTKPGCNYHWALYKVSSWSVSLKLYRTMVLVMIKHHIKTLKQSILQDYWRNCHSSQRWVSIKIL